MTGLMCMDMYQRCMVTWMEKVVEESSSIALGKRELAVEETVE